MFGKHDFQVELSFKIVVPRHLKSCNGNTIFKQAIFTNYIGTIIFYIINIKIILFNKKNPITFFISTKELRANDNTRFRFLQSSERERG